MEKKVIFGMGLLWIFSGQGMAQMSLLQTSVLYSIDFEQTINGVNNGPFAVSSGLLLLGSPASAGQLESQAWEIIADVANAGSPAGFNTAVLAGFNSLGGAGQASYGWGAWNLGNNHAMAMLPATSNGTPGSLTLKIQNNTGFSLTTLAIGYRVEAYNDKDRANSISFYHSADNITYTLLPQLTYLSPALATQSWDSATFNLSINNLDWQDGTYYYLRWFFQDESGSGLRDEFLVDDITLMASSAFTNSPEKLSFTGINDGIPPSAGEDFTVMITVTDSNGNAAAVQSPLPVTLSHYSGGGLLSGSLTDTLPPGQHTLVFPGIRISQAGNDLQLLAEAAGLQPDTSEPVTVLPKASYMAFTTFTDTVNVGEFIPEFSVEARRPDHSPDLNFHGQITMQKFIGPGNLQGSLTHTCEGGFVSFDDVFLDQAGNYLLQAVSDSMAPVLIGILVVMPLPVAEEIIVPRYFGAKSATNANNCRTPFAVCLRFTGQTPLTTYKLQAGLALADEPASSYGAGNIWNGTAFNTSAIPVSNYFITNSTGNSGPVWIFLQPTGNSLRFEAGTQHQLRLSICPNGSVMPPQPMFRSNSLMTALDISSTPRTTDTTDDGAFLVGKTDESLGGKFILLYDNTEGSGMPVFCTQIRTSWFTNTVQSNLPGAVDSVWRQIPDSITGEFAAVIPLADTLGIRRLEIRSADNVLLASQQDADGIWPQGANTVNVARRQMLHLSQEEIPLVNVIRGSVIYHNDINSPLDSCLVQLTDCNGNLFQCGLTDLQGNYIFTGIPNGTYSITITCAKQWGGGNAQDALRILQHFTRINLLQSQYLNAAQVSQLTGTLVNSVDALYVIRRFTGLINTFPAGDWIFSKAQVTVESSGIVIVNFHGLCRGDVNGDYYPE